MPRKKRARRLDPWGGVSELAINAEAEYVAREVDDYLILSLKDLEVKLAERRRLLDQVQQELDDLRRRLPERERLALDCIMYRDFHHLGALYRTYLAGQERPAVSVEEASVKHADPVPLPFREWLFPSDENEG